MNVIFNQSNEVSHPKSVHIWEYRRKNLHGTTIKAISGKWAPFITNIYFNMLENKIEIKGLYADLWKELSGRLNFTTHITKLPSSVKTGICKRDVKGGLTTKPRIV